jgi:predicted HD phosphohydrolase
VFAALCHDVGKAISVPNHPAIAAEILKPYVRPEVYEMIRVHQDFQGRTTTPTSAAIPTPARAP